MTLEYFLNQAIECKRNGRFLELISPPSGFPEYESSMETDAGILCYFEPEKVIIWLEKEIFE
jgi:hypothetical protein